VKETVWWYMPESPGVAKFIVMLSLVWFIFGAPGLRAQDLGSIVGTVTDPSGAAVPGVKITVTNQQTGTIARVTTSNSTGSFAVPDLPVSTYSVRAQKTGFTRTVHMDIILNVRSTVRVNLQLSLGSVSQEVTVTAPAVHLQTETGSESQTISGTHVAEIDTNGRNFVQLAMLVPGAAGPSLVGALNTPVGVTSNTYIAFNGEQPDHNVWSVDGVENYDRGCGGCIEVVPDQDAIQEFRVLSSNTSQDVGFGSGAHIQVELKSGTNQYHGEAFEFNRNTALDASSFFANASNTPKPALIFNDFGFNIGGPIYLPGHQKKTFFFFEGDWRRLLQGTTIFAPGVPLAWTAGDFTGANQVILNHNAPTVLPNGQTGYMPFANNQIPSAMLNPNALILGKPNFIFPSPNTAGGQFYAASPSVPTSVNEQIVRIDHQFSDKTSLMFHYIRDGINQQFPTTLWSGDTYPTVGTDFLNQPQSFMLKLTRSISPTLLNEAMVSFNRQPLTLLPTGTFQQPAGLSIQSLFPGTNTDNRIPTIGLFGPALGTQYDVASWPWTNVLNTWTYRDSLSKISGSHSLNFGGEYMHYLKEQELFGNTQGNFTFNGSATGGSYLGPNGQILTTPGNEFADFMLGNAYSYTELQKQTMPAYLNNFYGLWAGDQWRVKSGLNLDYGLRWEGMPHAYERHNDVSAFRTQLYNASQAPKFNSNGTLIPGSGNFLDGIGIAGQGGIPPGLVDNHWANFEPRFGFAWQPWAGRNTVIRGGYGLFYENIQGNDIYNAAPNPPFSNSPLLFNTSLSNPGIVPGTLFPGNIQTFDPRYLQPYSQQWSFGVQHQFNTKTVFSLMYVGSEGTDENLNVNLNQPLGPVVNEPINMGVPFPGWANIGYYQNSVSSNYNSLQASLRFSDWHGLTSGVAYTWSHCLDYTDGDVGGFIQNTYNVAAEYGNCGFNIPQMLVINYVYSLPIFNNATGLTRTMLGGWQFSGISTFYSGSPITVGFPGDPAECGCSNYRANVIGNPNQGTGIHNASEWFNTAAFAPIPLGQFGNGARNIAYGDGIDNWDISLFKNFSGIPFPKSKEGASLQLRVEVFNFFNTTQFNGYFSTFGQTGFGAPNSTLEPREIQLGAKFMF